MVLTDLTNNEDDKAKLSQNGKERFLEQRVKELEELLAKAVDAGFSKEVSMNGDAKSGEGCETSDKDEGSDEDNHINKTETDGTNEKNHEDADKEHKKPHRTSSSSASEGDSLSATKSTLRQQMVAVGKRGYLFKWQDRSIGWSGTRWALRFVSLDGGRISYYRSHNRENESSPRYVLSLRGCAVRDDGWKANRRYHDKHKKKNKNNNDSSPPPLEQPGAYFHVFSIYQRPSNATINSLSRANSNASDHSNGSGNNLQKEEEEEEEDVTPLLRFSTLSLAEKNQWIKLISESCAYCESEQFSLDEAARADELQRQYEQQQLMTMSMPEATPGTLPPLYFATQQSMMNNNSKTKHVTLNVHPQKIARRRNHPRGRHYRSKSAHLDAEQMDARSTKGYPPSKPMHRGAGISYLSNSSSAPVQNYRGFFNLGMIILILSNFRLILDTVKINGFALQRWQEHVWNMDKTLWIKEFISNNYFLFVHTDLLLVDITKNNGQRDSSQVIWDVDFLLFGFILQNWIVITAFVIEWFLSSSSASEGGRRWFRRSRRFIHTDGTHTMDNNNNNNNRSDHEKNSSSLIESIGMILHNINAHGFYLLCNAIVWYKINNPFIGAILIVSGTITWMKLLSYIHANQDYRLANTTSKSTETTNNGVAMDSHQATLALIENLDPYDKEISYPTNITLLNLYYFWFAPTLTYQIAFPKSSHKVRLWYIAGVLFRLIVCFALSTFLISQVVSPALNNLVLELKQTGGVYTIAILTKYWLKLAIANIYLWLLMFYSYFHLILNLCAELLRFGDRVFYKDWWNSSELSSYWRLWNLPVHYWLIRHIYFPFMRRCNSVLDSFTKGRGDRRGGGSANVAMSKSLATFFVFFFSAILHEVLVSVPFHMIRPWSFLGMMAQIPLVAVTKYLDRCYPGSSIGNIIFWISFCVVGQPTAIMLYTVDYNLYAATGSEATIMNTASTDVANCTSTS